MLLQPFINDRSLIGIFGVIGNRLTVKICMNANAISYFSSGPAIHRIHGEDRSMLPPTVLYCGVFRIKGLQLDLKLIEKRLIVLPLPAGRALFLT